MRAHHAFALACIATVLVGQVAAQAQPSSVFTADVKVNGATTLAPGEHSGLTITATRGCTSPGQVLPAGTVEIHVVATSGVLTVTGPTAVALPQMVCTQNPSQTVEGKMDATARSDLGENFTQADEVLVFQVRANAQDNLNRSPGDAVVSTHFLVKAPDKEVVALADTEKASPTVGPLLAAGIVGLAALARRRSA
ncbi:MAG: hypothetical protein V4510_07310 [bacterium]